MMDHPSMGPSDHYKDLVASLALLNVPLMEDTIPGIVTSFEPGEMKTMTSVLIKHLHDLDGQDLVNAFLFLSAITSAREDAPDFLTNELIDKTYHHMLKAESERHEGITGAAMTLLANIAVYYPEEVIERLEIDEEHPQSSEQKTLDLITNKIFRDWEEGTAAQNTPTVDDWITHRQYLGGPPESFHLCHHLLHPSYGSISPLNSTYVLHDTETTQAAMRHYITRILTDEERRKVIHYLLIAMRSAVRTSKLISIMFFSELLRHPELLERNLAKNIILLMASKMDSSDEFEVCLAVEAMGNASDGAPKQVHQLKDVIFGCLWSKLSSHRKIKVFIKSLQALSKYVCLLKRSKLGSKFGHIVNFCINNLNHPNLQIQAYSTSLFAVLAQNCNRNKKDFSQHVRECLPDLLIKLHSKDQQIKASGVAALMHCLPYIGCKNVEELLSADGEKSCKIYEKLGRKEPALLVKMMLRSTELLYMVDEVDAVLKHFIMIIDALPYEELYPTAFSDVFKGLRRLNTEILNPTVQRASYRAIDILRTKLKPDLLIKLHIKEQQMEASGVAALMCCLPCIRCNNEEELLSDDSEKSYNIYEQLGRKKPALLVKMMLQCIEMLHMAEDVDNVLKHLTMIRDALPYEELYPTALSDVVKGLRRINTEILNPTVQEASNRAIDILSTKWKSIGTVKVVKLGTRGPSIYRREFTPEPRIDRREFTPEPRIDRREFIIYETSV